MEIIRAVEQFEEDCFLDSVKLLYEDLKTYFCTTYSGQFKLPAWNTVYKARKDREESGITDDEECRAFEKILAA